MSLPAFYLIPPHEIAPRVIELPALTGIDVEFERLGEAIASPSNVCNVTRGCQLYVTFSATVPSTDVATLTALQNVRGALMRGRAVGLTADRSKTYALFPTAAITHGDTDVTVGSGGSEFTVWDSVLHLSAGDRFVIDHAPPECDNEDQQVAGWNVITYA